MTTHKKFERIQALIKFITATYKLGLNTFAADQPVMPGYAAAYVDTVMR